MAQERIEDSPDAQTPAEARPAHFPQVEARAPTVAARNIDALHDVDVTVTVQLGRSTMFIRDILRLRIGSTVELDKLAGEQIDLYVNDAFLARGEVVVIGDALAIRITEIAGEGEDETAQNEE